MSLNTFFWKAIKFVLLRLDSAKQRLELFLAWLENRGKPVVREIQGSKMCLSLEDRGISRDLLLCDVREEFPTKEFKKRIKKGMIIVDIGANIGYYALMEAKLVGKNGLVYAFEPVPENIKALKDNIELNRYENVKIIKKALGNKKRKTAFFLAETSNEGTMIQTGCRRSDGGKIEVEETTLDDFLNGKKADFVRMDVQGYEFDVIKGMEKTLNRKKLGLFIEMHSSLGKNKIELLKVLHSHGFRKCMVIKDLTPLALKRISRHLPKKSLSLHEEYEAPIEQLIKNPPKGWFHLFAEKG